jgi:hypothetical protein
MTWLPLSPGSTLVLRLIQETVHDFILPFLPPCGPHLTPLATGSLESSLLVLFIPRGLTGNDLSRLFFTYTSTSQAATCTCNTWPIISPHNGVNHSSHHEATIHRSSNHTCVGVLDRQTYQGGTRGSRLCGEDRDRETENSKVCARTRDTRFIQVRVAKVASPTSCLGDQVWRPALGVVCPRRDWGCAARYPALLYIVQGVGS